MDYYIHKQGHLIMQAHKYGRINLMIQNLIFGHWAALFMK
jgi:hypothetical protein